ncbi:hypothetical protein EDD18DRAFT_1107272 [Armillaria luteobubalina]|uniref:Uncharacterized protein n=1 Tax=Armillaria luteobubalina TaxID=153913 RepID=A0AA39Q161_9AGAR|nr:hypothetical protein EDD18DRAFT_1107272 [Armillaria luteobubalina]
MPEKAGPNRGSAGRTGHPIAGHGSAYRREVEIFKILLFGLEGCHVRLPPGFLSPFQMAKVESPEEHQVAHNASSCHSYAKYLKHSCIVGLLIIYSGIATQSTRSNEAIIERRKVKDMGADVHCSLLAETMDQIERLSIKFALVMHGSLKVHANAVYQLYQESITADHPKGYCSVLDNAVLEILTIEHSILQHEHLILNTVGVGKEMRWLHVVLDPIQTLISSPLFATLAYSCWTINSSTPYILQP